MVIALDLDMAAPLDEDATETGAGGALRLGRKFSLLVASLTPEVGFGYHDFGGPSDVTMYRGFIGGRLAFGKIIEPSLFGHVGAGKYDARVGDHWAPVVEGGVALDFTLLPLLDLGVHASYNALLARDDYRTFDWAVVGLHGALVF